MKGPLLMLLGAALMLAAAVLLLSACGPHDGSCGCEVPKAESWR